MGSAPLLPLLRHVFYLEGLTPSQTQHNTTTWYNHQPVKFRTTSLLASYRVLSGCHRAHSWRHTATTRRSAREIFHRAFGRCFRASSSTSSAFPLRSLFLTCCHLGSYRASERCCRASRLFIFAFPVLALSSSSFFAIFLCPRGVVCVNCCHH